MIPSDLHIKYAPILHFARGERFFPMRADHFLSYAALFGKDGEAPLVSQGEVRIHHLMRVASGETFLRSVMQGPQRGIEVAREWGGDTLRLLYNWSRSPTCAFSEAAAKRLYDWFSLKTAEATRHFWWNRLLMGDPEAERADLPRFRLPPTVRDAAVDNYERSQGPRPAYSYYYRIAPMGNYVVLQYWFFYAYNDWANSFGGFNDHEGDWEGLQLFFRRQGGRLIEPPLQICYLGHHSRISKPWEHHDIQRTGTHPHVYVAAGSHASYPERKPYTIMALYNLVDYATGDGLTLSHDEWQGRINLEDALWLQNYLGSWGTRYWLPLAWLQRALFGLAALIPGEIGLPGVSAPRGPRYNDEGQARETWADSLRFAGLLES